MLNYHTVVSTAVDLLERAVPDPRRGERPGHPNHISQVGAVACIISGAWQAACAFCRAIRKAEYMVHSPVVG